MATVHQARAMVYPALLVHHLGIVGACLPPDHWAYFTAPTPPPGQGRPGEKERRPGSEVK